MQVISSGGRNRLSTLWNRRGCGIRSAVATVVSAGIRFSDPVQGIDLRVFDGLLASRWPADDHTIDRAAVAEAEVQDALVLRREPGGRGHFLQLPVPLPLHLDAGADGTPVTGGSLERELDPVTVGGHLVAIEQERSLLVGDDDVQGAAVGEVG